MHCAFHLSTAGGAIFAYQYAASLGYAESLTIEEIVFAYHVIAAQDYADFPIQIAGKISCGHFQYGKGRKIFMNWLKNDPPRVWLTLYHVVHNFWGYLFCVGLTSLLWPKMIWWVIFGYPLHLLIDYPTHRGPFRIRPLYPIKSRWVKRLGLRLMFLEVEIWYWCVGWYFTRGHHHKRLVWRRFVVGDWDTKDWATYVEYPAWTFFVLTAVLNLTMF